MGTSGKVSTPGTPSSTEDSPSHPRLPAGTRTHTELMVYHGPGGGILGPTGSRDPIRTSRPIHRARARTDNPRIPLYVTSSRW